LGVWHWQRVVHAWRPAGYGHECLKGQAGWARIKRTPRVRDATCRSWKLEATRSVPLRQDARRQTQDDARTQAVSPSPSARTPACTSAQASTRRARPPGNLPLCGGLRRVWNSGRAASVATKRRHPEDAREPPTSQGTRAPRPGNQGGHSLSTSSPALRPPTNLPHRWNTSPLQPLGQYSRHLEQLRGIWSIYCC
jgi:hypothetical protein